VDDLTAEILSELSPNAAEDGVPAGIIGEIGCSWPWTEAERRSMAAAVAAQRESGAVLTVHPGRHPDAPFEILDFLRRAGADLSRTIMDHVERRLFEIDDFLRLADTGCVLEFDLFGIETSYFAQARDVDASGDGARITAIRALIDAGHGDRIVVSHDICQRTRQVEFGGHGYGHVFRNVVPMMRRRDFEEDEIEAILVSTPARLLAFV
jgi:phosphotriesterase-related protein